MKCRYRRRPARCRPISPVLYPGTAIRASRSSASWSRPACRISFTKKRNSPRSLPETSGPAARCSRSLVSFTWARWTGTISIIWCPVLRNVKAAEEGPILVHVVTQKGKGYPPCRSFPGQISRRFSLRCRFRAAGEGKAQRAKLHQGLRRKPHRRRAQGRADRRRHRRDGVRHRHRPVQKGIPEARFRRRHRRAACGDVRGGPRHRRHEAFLRDLFDFPAASL